MELCASTVWTSLILSFSKDDAGLSGLQVDRAVQVQPLAPGRHINRATLAAWQPPSGGFGLDHMFA